MKILIFSVMPLPLLDLLGEHLAGDGHDVINLSGKRSRGRSSPGVRRIIMNFDEGGRAGDHLETWKRALKNGSFGLKALRNFASSWQPDLIFCRSGQGAAFFIREVFPDAFLCSFASDSHEGSIAIELDSRLFLESHLCFAPDKKVIAGFPPLLRGAIQLEPICVDADFFRSGRGKPFSCWKLEGVHNAIGIVLTGLSRSALQTWVRALAAALAQDKGMAAVVLTDKGGVAAGLIKAMDTMPGKIGKRIFVADHLEMNAWRDLCASVPVVFTSESQKRHMLECVVSGGSAWIASSTDMAEIPGARLLSPHKSIEVQLKGIRRTAPDTIAIEAIRREYGCAGVISEFAARILSEYCKSVAIKLCALSSGL